MYQQIEGKKYKIDCKLWSPEKVSRIIIAVHGFAGDKESGAIASLAEEMVKKDTLVVALDLPGHGTSEVDGDYLTLENCLDNITSVEEYYHNQYKDAKLSYFATSFGAYLVLLKLIKKPQKYDKIVLRCPALKMDKIFVNAILRESIKDFRKRTYTIVGYERELKVNYSFYEELENTQIFELFQKDENKILIIHGDQDDTAPIEDSYAFQAKYQTEMEVVKGADHRFKKEGELEEVIAYAEQFYEN